MTHKSSGSKRQYVSKHGNEKRQLREDQHSQPAARALEVHVRRRAISPHENEIEEGRAVARPKEGRGFGCWNVLTVDQIGTGQQLPLRQRHENELDADRCKHEDHRVIHAHGSKTAPDFVTFLIFRQLPEIDAKRAQLAIQMCALHAHSLRQLPDLAVAKYQLLLQIRTLEMFARLSQRERQ